MNKAFEKILDGIESYIEDAKSEGDFSYIKPFEIAKIAVQEVAEEYNGGWFPCSERLPEIDGNTSDIVLVCGSNGFQYMAFWCDDLKWRFCECGMAKNPILWTEIVAWQPLPEPYKESED